MHEEINESRVLTIAEAVCWRKQAASDSKNVVLTNGCFDILHVGHLRYLEQSRRAGDLLIVAVNSDASVRELKGPSRPVNSEMDRAEALVSLRFVDAVIIFPGIRLTDEILALSPDIYTKAADYDFEKLDNEEREALLQVGADIRFVPLAAGHSTTRMIETLKKGVPVQDRLCFKSTLMELEGVIRDCQTLDGVVTSAGMAMLRAFRGGSKVLTCGNGGSAADALHLAEELVGRYRVERDPLPALCINADTTYLTCVANDYGYDFVFSRAIRALGRQGDILVCFTTSGNSKNVLKAIHEAKAIGLTTVLLTGKDGGEAKGLCDHELLVPSNETARIQELHTVILHQWLELVDNEYKYAGQ